MMETEVIGAGALGQAVHRAPHYPMFQQAMTEGHVSRAWYSLAH